MSSFESSERIEALVDLAGTMAHELNNIFTAVAGNLSLLGQSETDDAQSTATIQDAVRAAQRGIDFTAKLQAFAGRQRLKRKNHDLNYLVLQTIAPLQETILNTIDVRLALTESSCIAYTDEEKFCELIIELARNAKAAMPNGGVLKIESAVIHAGAAMARDVIHIRISDTGCGMSPEVAARATEPLFSTRHASANLGWGLSRCAGFIRQCGGRMGLTSTVGQGTAVDILLPLVTTSVA